MSPALAASFFAAREDPSLVVLEGFHALKHALRFGAVVEAAVTSDPDELAELSAALAPDVAAALETLVQPVEPAALRALGFPRPPHTGVAAIARRPPFDLGGLLAGNVARPIVLLEDPRHLGNVGAVVRVAAAADAAGVVTTGARDPWDSAALRGAAGLHYALPVGRADDGFDPAPRPLVALDPDGDPLPAAAIPPGAVLAFGTERHGLSDALLARADARLRIPMRDGVSSLNLATAVAAVLFSR
ncbi:TrmH family RNA methyltransferase [Conexibacter stalactiti]|uniref:TrmH family RNA methyltransferase n=1 Tax=Conexibacter stalactiti TaxID=1940611 RepID=A0ABU4HSD8_9ACTN|nr:TrmH family RNA methyltransferase [Conexibacter stalactiti]MDW5595597.1 TrmH family RNA methyltransferase [Conexibacter stalactiti]MEC5036239.1 TrmH family RNA methyltransferase [Conexibacter stalactiti]